ncbi:MAG: NAD(P)H-dependent oxidoreductase [Vicinamibacterales bacterium]
MHLLAVCGSLRAASVNSALLRAASRLAPPDVRITVSRAVAGLPLFNPDLEATLPAAVAAFHAEVGAADALIVASPEYAHGVTGVIKNALDWLVGFEPFIDMPVAVWNASPRAYHADGALRETLTTMSAHVVEEASVTLPLLGGVQDEDAMVASAEVADAVSAALEALGRVGRVRVPAPPRPSSGRPEPGEYADYAQTDIDYVHGTDAVVVLEALAAATLRLLRSLPESRIAGLRYAPGKWTVKDVVAHVVDDERIFAYRALCLARGETAPLPGFDEQVYAGHARGEDRAWNALLADYQAVRTATLTLLGGLSPEAWTRAGEVNGYRATPRGLAFHIAGHELHHMRLLRERYLGLM